MNANAIRVLMDYNAWANAQVLGCTEALTDEQFVEDIGYSLGSVRNHLVHIASVDNRWFARVSGKRVPSILNPTDYPDKEAVSRLWSVVYHDIGAYLEVMTDEDVERIVEYDGLGNIHHTLAWQILVHVVNHGTDHRAQMLWTLNKLGVPTVEQDFIFYLRDEMPPRGLIRILPEAIQSLFQYDTSMTTRLAAESLNDLPDKKLDQVFNYSHGTLRKQLAHIMVAQDYWIGRARGISMDTEHAASTFMAVHQYVNQLDRKALMEPVEYKTSMGISHANLRWEMLFQLVNHGTDHRAQMLAMLHELDAPTFEQDLMIHYWASEAAE